MPSLSCWVPETSTELRPRSRHHCQGCPCHPAPTFQGHWSPSSSCSDDGPSDPFYSFQEGKRPAGTRKHKCLYVHLWRRKRLRPPDFPHLQGSDTCMAPWPMDTVLLSNPSQAGGVLPTSAVSSWPQHHLTALFGWILLKIYFY